MPSVLGLDLASHTGWCLVTGMDCVPRFGWWDAPDERFGVYRKRFSALHLWLDEMHQVHQFDGIAFECPIKKPTDKVSTLRLLMGFSCVVEEFAGLVERDRGQRFPCMEVSVPDVKKALTGDPYASKPDMKHAATRLGWRVADADQADAGSVAFTAFANFWPERAVAA